MKMLTPNERSLYEFLLQAYREEDGFVKESQREIAMIIGCSTGGIAGGVKSLVKKGFISVKADQGLVGMEVEILKELKNEN